ncbi:MAG: hypothetical protein JST04_12115 [Bdellovibrionales bacterium]|nr:hypothetical protein [Bdellovibrionales bacterium]
MSMNRVLFFGLFGLFAALSASAAVPFKKVMIVVFENEDASRVLDQPHFKDFAAKGAYLGNFVAETHPSQGNYIALVSGDLHGVRTDSNVNIDAKHVGDLLEAAGMNWKIYLEGYPGNCFTGARSGQYARKHNPFVSFKNVQTDPARCNRHLVGAGEVDRDIQAGTLPEFSVYVPDLQNDGHDTGVAYADRWFGNVFGAFARNPKFMKDMLVIATFDESSLTGGNRIYTALYGDSVVGGSVSKAPATHYSILRLVEDAFGLGNLGASDRSANRITGIWR